ncbi:MAG: hypothetical protein Q7R50_01335 [Dehalococcoidales bacterium]|nr:hypothetical protein [Dehalococcoidales bacterium]
MKSNVPERSVAAILDTIYSIRCNLFHGHKGYDAIQIQLLVPVTVLLEKVVTALYEKLNVQTE